MPNLTEFYLFREYTKAVKEFCQKSVYLSRFPPEYNWQVIFGTIDQAWAKVVIPLINGKNPGPNAILEPPTMERADGELLGGFHYGLFRNENERFDAALNPLVYRLEYKLTYFASTLADADIITYQLLTSAPKERKYATFVNDSWCEMMVHSPTNETALEPEESKSKVHRFSVGISIPRAYINFPPIREDIPEIEQISMSVENVEDISYV